MYTIIPGPPEDSILDSTARINIWHGPVRSSKTIHSLIRFVEFVYNAPTGGELFIIGVTEDTAERNILKPLKAMLGNVFDYSRGSHTWRIGKREGWILGAANKISEAKIRGATAAGIYGDELTLWPVELLKQSFMRLSVRGSKFFGATNPGGPYHPLKTDYIDRAGDLDLRAFHWPIDVNIMLDPDYISNLKREYVGLWYDRFVLGLWRAAEGAVYDFFDEARHTIKDAPGPADYYIVPIDYGTSNATAAVLLAINEKLTPKVWAQGEYYHSGRDTGKTKTDEQYADDILKWLERDGVIRTRVNIQEARLEVDPACISQGFITGPKGRLETLILDPSAASFRAALTRRGLPVRQAVNNVIDGIRTQAAMLESGDYRVMKTCVQTMRDYGAYLWDTKAQERGEDKPLKQHDHTKDAERYGLHTWFASRDMTSAEDALEAYGW
jgi:PBSX family phage terminase large subunit